MKKKRHLLVPLAGLLFVCGICLFVFLRWTVQSDLNRLCETAQTEFPHPGDDVAALLAYFQSESHSLTERNRAIWALGQARDARALPVLKPLHTDQECDHQNVLCQQELDKAISLCEGRTPNLLFIRVRPTTDRP